MAKEKHRAAFLIRKDQAGLIVCSREAREDKFNEDSRWQAAMMKADVPIWYAELWQHSIILRNTGGMIDQRMDPPHKW